MRHLATRSLRHPRGTLLTTAALLALALPGVARLELATDGAALAPRSDPTVAYDRTLRRRLDLADPVVVVVRTDHPDGIFNPHTLERVRTLSDRLGQLPGVAPDRVRSLATEPGLRHRPGSLTRRRLLEPLPRTPRELDRLRRELERIGLYDGVLVSRQGDATAILLGLTPGPDRSARVHRILELTASADGPDTVEVVGAPVAEALLGEHVLADLGLALVRRPPEPIATGRSGPGLVVLALAVLGIVLWLGLRRLAAAVIPLVGVGVSLLVVAGTLGWLGVPVTLPLVVVPVILTAVGVADEIHLFHRFTELARRAPGTDTAPLVAAALDEMASPLVHTSATTAVALLSFAASPIGPVRTFGLATAGGVGVCLLVTFTTVPALLVLAGRERLLPRRPRAGQARLAIAPISGVRRHPRIVLLVAAGLALVAAAGVPRLRVEDSWLDGFAPESSFVQATRRFEAGFLGSHLLRVVVEAPAATWSGQVPATAVVAHGLHLPATSGVDPARLAGSRIRLAVAREGGRRWQGWIEGAERQGVGVRIATRRRDGSARLWLGASGSQPITWEIEHRPLLVPDTLQRIERLEGFLAGRPEVGGVIGPASVLATTGVMLSPQDRGARRLPEDAAAARRRWHNYAVVRGKRRLGRLIDPECLCLGVVTAYLPSADFTGTGRLIGALEAWAAEQLAPAGLRMRLAGDVAVSRALIRAVTTTQLTSIALCLVAILVLAGLLGRSLAHGLLVLLPPALAILTVLGVMGWAGIPLGVATSMFAAMTLGVGVDYGIHLVARHRRARRSGLGAGAAVTAALAEAGPAITLDGVAVGAGFAVLMASRVPANARLGALLVLAVVTCLAAALLVLPALLTVGGRCRDGAPASRHPGQGPPEPPQGQVAKAPVSSTGEAGWPNGLK